jgi:hypothetical protein
MDEPCEMTLSKPSMRKNEDDEKQLQWKVAGSAMSDGRRQVRGRIVDLTAAGRTGRVEATVFPVRDILLC